jgi:hypothetical protein
LRTRLSDAGRAGLTRPFARLLAARRPGEIQGLVLLDPTIVHLSPPSADGLGGIRRRLQRCLTAAETAPAAPRGDPQWEGCISAKTDAHSEAIARKPTTWRNQLSELDAIFGRTSEQVARTRGLLSAVPAYVITASETAAGAPTIGYDKPQSVWELQHLRLALEFDHGSQRTVLSSHLVQNDRPEIVTEAVGAMVKAVRDGLRPPALPPSETTPSDGESAFPEAPR